VDLALLRGEENPALPQASVHEATSSFVNGYPWLSDIYSSKIAEARSEPKKKKEQ
jgi:hypothetical protein